MHAGPGRKLLEKRGIGYPGWSWCGNSSDVSYLDMVNNWDVNSLTSWGEKIINGANGITGTTTTTSASASTTTSTSGGTCSPSTSISVPFTQNGTGSYCWETTSDIRYINSWNLTVPEVNGVDFTNTLVNGSGLPDPIDGRYYIYYESDVSWGHFEAN